MQQLRWIGVARPARTEGFAVKKVFLPSMVAAVLSLSSGWNVANAQNQGYGLGLTGSSYPVQQYGSQASQPSFFTTGTSVGTGVQTRFAQNSTQLPSPDHVHIPPGNYSFGGESAVQGQSVPGYSVPSTGQLPSPTVQASGTQPSYPVAPQHQGYIESTPMPQGYPMGAVQPTAPAYSYSGSAGCSTCGPAASQPVYSSGPVYSSVPAYSYGSSAGCAPAPAPTVLSVVSPRPWIFGANALLFERIDDEYVRFASDSNMPSMPLLSTNDVDFGHAGGFEIFGGRYFGCGRFAVVASYWSLFPESQMAAIGPVAGVNQRTNIPFTTRGIADPNVYYGIELPTSNVYNRYDGTYAQRIRRDQDFQTLS